MVVVYRYKVGCKSDVVPTGRTLRLQLGEIEQARCEQRPDGSGG
jgi:hypothetical protein